MEYYLFVVSTLNLIKLQKENTISLLNKFSVWIPRLWTEWLW